MLESVPRFEYEQSPLDTLEQSIPSECRPDRDYLAKACDQFQNLKELLVDNSYLLKKLLELHATEPNKLQIILDPEINLMLTVDQGEIVVMIPSLGCSVQAFNEISANINEGEYCIYESDSSWLPLTVAHANACERWSYTPGEIAPKEYLAAAITTFDNEPLKVRLPITFE